MKYPEGNPENDSCGEETMTLMSREQYLAGLRKLDHAVFVTYKYPIGE